MAVLIDIFGSSLIAGIVFLLIFKINVFSSNQRFASDSELQLQQNAKTLAEMINYDLRKIGYEIERTHPFIEATSTRLKYYADMNRDGVEDSVTYFVGDSLQAVATTNPSDRVLYRVVNTDTTKGPTLGLTRLQFTYLNGMGVQTANLSDIRYVKAELWVETYEPVNDRYPYTYWELTINPRNL